MYPSNVAAQREKLVYVIVYTHPVVTKTAAGTAAWRICWIVSDIDS